MSEATLPTLFIPHGGGPWPWVEAIEKLHGSLRGFLEALPSRFEGVRAVLVVSAHWEAPVATVMSAARPPMLYDFFGFPDHTYQLQWPAPGAPELAARIAGLLDAAGVESAPDATRGFDHGCFVPMALAYPEAKIPTLQLSLVKGLDPRQHLRIGAALAPLRREGVLILGSGMSYHNMGGFDRGGGAADGVADARRFDQWLAEVVQRDGFERENALADWSEAPSARACHPREEHLIPLHVVAGAAHGDPATLPFRESVLGVAVSAIQFGG